MSFDGLHFYFSHWVSVFIRFLRVSDTDQSGGEHYQSCQYAHPNTVTVVTFHPKIVQTSRHLPNVVVIVLIEDVDGSRKADCADRC